jgi:glycogen debranching enzyme
MRATPSYNLADLKTLGINAIRELEVADGILASGRDEAYGCIFGRDSLITALSLLRAHERQPEAYYLRVAEKVLRSLANLQGRCRNIESGEEPGKIVHEYRPHKHEHLTQLAEDPWFVYPEGVMRNYDTVDATPLFLMAAAAYQKAGDGRFAATLAMPVSAALEWLLRFEGFVSYEFHPDRTHGGLKVQSWMDSTESLFYEEDDARPPYPIAPVEVQAYAWAALKAWGEDARAAALKKKFNHEFVLRGPKSITLAYALDGKGRKLSAPRSSMSHVLWAAHGGESILDEEHIEPLRRRLLSRDLFVPSAGIRTLSNRSRHFDPMSYHNGSIWPHDTAMLADGLEQFGYRDDAARVRRALIGAYAHFKTPIELFSYKRGIKEYAPESGHRACRMQAWSAAGLLSALSAVQ